MDKINEIINFLRKKKENNLFSISIMSIKDMFLSYNDKIKTIHNNNTQIKLEQIKNDENIKLTQIKSDENIKIIQIKYKQNNYEECIKLKQDFEYCHNLFK